MGDRPEIPETLGEGGRYRIGRKLGAGGMGIVYAAHDGTRDAEVALKLLRRPDPDGLFRFKREFRALTDIHHANLVNLYELVADDDRWFFTMELLVGVDFVTYVRGSARAPLHSEANTIAVGTTTRPVVPAAAGVGSESSDAPAPADADDGAHADLTRLRAALPQLVRGVMALHEGGHLHRDIKPSNVLVTVDGRVVLLDFGVVAELGARGQERGREIVGTPTYMAPEQGIGQSAGPASDWYSVGVLLFEALTGGRPFASRRADVLTDKLMADAPSPSQSHPGTPADLSALCVDLLARDPGDRPTGAQILERLAAKATTSITPRPAPAADDLVLFGRQPALDELRRAFAGTRDGKAGIVLVRGASGTGKTALIKRFARHVEGFGALVLAGRCYERESVPFKALDPIMDELCTWLMAVEPELVDDILPEDAPRLGQLFPVLQRVEQIERASESAPTAEPRELRRRAGLALREILARIAEQRPVVVFIDDLQWGDADSVPLVEALLRPPDAPAVLWIVCTRDTQGDSPLVPSFAEPRRGLTHAEIDIGPLPEDDARALAEQLLGQDTSAAETIARESGGNPFFIRELVRSVTDGGAATGEPLALAAMILRRVDALAEADRCVVEAVAVAARPIDPGRVFAACALAPSDQAGIVPRLVRLQLLRTSSGPGGPALECYHDRIRESVVAGLDDVARADMHRRLAEVLEASGVADPQTLVDHRVGAGDLQLAAAHARRAADAAADALAFERAAKLYELALSVQPPDPAAEADLRRRLGEAWAQAGRGAEAADAFLAAALLESDPATAASLRRQAGEQLVRAGRINRGLALVKETLRTQGLKVPSTGAGAILSLLTQRGLLRLRGLQFESRAPDTIDPGRLHYTDACWTAAIGLVQIEPLLGSVFATRHLRAALRAGDPIRVTRGVLLEALLLSSGGTRSREITQRYLDRGRELVAALDEPDLRFLERATRGVTAFELGEFEAGYTECEAALALHDRESSGRFWELGQVQLFGALAGVFSGQFKAVADVIGDRVADAQRRGDQYTVTCLRGSITPILAVVADDPADARREVEQALALWGRPEVFDNQHFMAFVAGCVTDLYAADLDAALARCEAADGAMRASLLEHVQVIRCTWRLLRSLCRLRVAARGHDARLLRTVAADARRLRREGAAWCEGAAAMLQAGLDALAGRDDAALASLREAEAQFQHGRFDLFRLPVRWRLAERLGDATVQREVENTLRGEGVVDPVRWAAAFAPLGTAPGSTGGHGRST
jgi:serine/threonine protein kinase/tetratricopeptide (TPR) repeat protein